MNGFGQLLWGDNHVRFGPDKHVFAAMFHELLCLRNMCIALEVGPGRLSTLSWGTCITALTTCANGYSARQM